jgi:hypothetical protein
VLGGISVDFIGVTGIIINSNGATRVWLNGDGVIETGVSGFPLDRTTYVPLAEVVSNTSTITDIIDLRGETFLQVPSLNLLGLSATSTEINQALYGIDGNVTASTLNRLTAGPQSTADNEHHITFFIFSSLKKTLRRHLPLHNQRQPRYQRPAG